MRVSNSPLDVQKRKTGGSSRLISRVNPTVIWSSGQSSMVH